MNLVFRDIEIHLLYPLHEWQVILVIIVSGLNPILKA